MPITLFHGALCVNNTTTFFKILILIFTFFLLLLSEDYFKFGKEQHPEFIILVLLTLLGMFLLVSANDFIIFYLALELQSFCLYVLAALTRYSNLSIEAALKYIIFGSFASGTILFGISFVYGSFGTANFFEINILLHDYVVATDSLTLAIFGFLLVSAGIFFKIGLFPFHF